MSSTILRFFYILYAAGQSGAKRGVETGLDGLTDFDIADSARYAVAATSPARREVLVEKIQANAIPKSRRGRKSMGAEDRLAVSARLKKYWADRRRVRSTLERRFPWDVVKILPDQPRVS
jgi:hypothetical protein